MFIVELSAGIALLVYKNKLEKGFREGLHNGIEKYGKKDEGEITRAFDELQKKVRKDCFYEGVKVTLDV